jgi:hypothetical protein
MAELVRFNAEQRENVARVKAVRRPTIEVLLLCPPSPKQINDGVIFIACCHTIGLVSVIDR